MTRQEMAGCRFRASYGNDGVRYYVLRPTATRWERITECEYTAAGRLVEEGYGTNLPNEYVKGVERISFEISTDLPEDEKTTTQYKFEAGKVYLVRNPYGAPWQFRCTRRTEKMVWLSRKSVRRSFLIHSVTLETGNTIEYVNSIFGTIYASNSEDYLTEYWLEIEGHPVMEFEGRAEAVTAFCDAMRPFPKEKIVLHNMTFDKDNICVRSAVEMEYAAGNARTYNVRRMGA